MAVNTAGPTKGCKVSLLESYRDMVRTLATTSVVNWDKTLFGVLADCLEEMGQGLRSKFFRAAQWVHSRKCTPFTSWYWIVDVDRQGKVPPTPELLQFYCSPWALNFTITRVEVACSRYGGDSPWQGASMPVRVALLGPPDEWWVDVALKTLMPAISREDIKALGNMPRVKPQPWMLKEWECFLDALLKSKATHSKPMLWHRRVRTVRPYGEEYVVVKTEDV